MSQGPGRPVPRTYTLPELFNGLKSLMLRLPALWSIWTGGRLPRALREKVVVAVAHARDRVVADFAPIAKDGSQDALVEVLGPQTYRDVEDVARVMTVANRIANTLNALPDRLRGNPVPDSRLFDELFINFMFLPGAWLGTLVAAARQRKSPFAVWRQARSFEGRSISG
jgi:hypothetical protein